MNRRRLVLLIASVAVSVVLLYFVLRDVPISDVIAIMRDTDPGYLLLAFLCGTLSLFTRGIRWWELLSRRLPLARAAHLVNIMFLGNQLPLRLGEVARSVLAKRDGIPLVTSATSIIVERLIDTLVVVLMIAAVIGQLPDMPAEIANRAVVFGLLALAGFAALLSLAWAPKFAHRLLDRLLALIPLLQRIPLKSILGNLLDGLQPLTNWRTLAYTLFWNTVAWSFSLATFYFLHLALGIEVNIALSVPLGISLAALSLALPVSVAGLGPFELAIVVAGQVVGMDQLEAISLGFLLHAITVAGNALWGTVGLVTLGVSPASAFTIQQLDSGDDG